MKSASHAAVTLGVARLLALIVLAIAVTAFVGWALVWAAFSSAHGKNWDRDEVLTEEGKIRNEYLSRAGALPTYRDGQPTGAFYHGNCCGFADAYEADDMFVDEAGNLFAVLTCNDPANCKEVPGKEVCGADEESGQTVCNTVGAKVTRPAGSRWLVPPDKVLLNHDPVNNTGHGWVYISPNATGPDGLPFVLCWAAPPGF